MGRVTGQLGRVLGEWEVRGTELGPESFAERGSQSLGRAHSEDSRSWQRSRMSFFFGSLEDYYCIAHKQQFTLCRTTFGCGRCIPSLSLSLFSLNVNVVDVVIVWPFHDLHQ